jgi:hypothetical protein
MATTITRLPTQVNLVLYEGDDFTFMVSVKDSSGQPVDLTGVTARAQIRASITAPAILGSFTPTVDALAGNIWLHLADTVSSALPSTGVWDVEIDRGGEITTLAAGTVSMTPDVTR